MEKLGVIGGMGAEATSYYYDQVVRHTAAACDQEHIDMVVLSKSTMPDRTLAIKTGEHAKLLATMKECAQALESLGCAHIAIPCNTSHYFYDQIQSFTKVPIIHMPRESVRYALAGAVMGECEFDPNLSMPAEPVHKIGIMGTDGTVGAGVYGRECKAAGVEVVYPSEKRQADVMSLIEKAEQAFDEKQAQQLEKKLQKKRSRDAPVTPHGKQTVRQLMGHGTTTNSIEVESPKDFDRVARRWNVDYAFYKTGPDKYLLFFKSGQADAITACFSEYSRRVLKRSKSQRVPIREQLKRAAAELARQPSHKKERAREAVHEDR